MSSLETKNASPVAGPHPSRSWELFEHGLLVFERALGPSGPFRVLLSRMELCPEHACSCRDVGLRAISLEVSGDSPTAGPTSEGLISSFKSNEAMQARLDLTLGTIEPDDEEGGVPLSAEWVDYVQSEMDGELLERLYERWLRAKGMEATERTDWPPRPPGGLVGWHEAHPDDRRDWYSDEEGLFLAEDLYCVAPACTCNEVRVEFAEFVEDGHADSIGSVRVRLPDGELLERESAPENRELINRLWRAFRARHRGTDRLAIRRQKMAELGRVRLESLSKAAPPPRAAARISRNDLCPCGSGKKYKRCCAP